MRESDLQLTKPSRLPGIARATALTLLAMALYVGLLIPLSRYMGTIAAPEWLAGTGADRAWRPVLGWSIAMHSAAVAGASLPGAFLLARFQGGAGFWRGFVLGLAPAAASLVPPESAGGLGLIFGGWLFWADTTKLFVIPALMTWILKKLFWKDTDRLARAWRE